MSSASTAVGGWYPTVCPEEFCTNKTADDGHVHIRELRIRLIELPYNAYQIQTRIHVNSLFSIVDFHRNFECMESVGEDDGQFDGMKKMHNSITKQKKTDTYLPHEETIVCDRGANSLIHRHVHQLDSLVAIFPKELLALIFGYNDLFSRLHTALYEGRYTHMITIEKDKWPKPALPLIKEALK